MSTTAWNHIVSKVDADKLLDVFGGFHDGCLREVHIWTESWVAPDLRMHCASDLDTRIRFYVQRQFRDPSAIELLFEQVVGFHLQPSAQNYDSIIFEATLLFDGDTICWADAAGWSPTDDKRDGVTWIAAKKAAWRDVSDWMGADLRYGAHDDTHEV
jgi:hypothetical protein